MDQGAHRSRESSRYRHGSHPPDHRRRVRRKPRLGRPSLPFQYAYVVDARTGAHHRDAHRHPVLPRRHRRCTAGGPAADRYSRRDRSPSRSRCWRPWPPRSAWAWPATPMTFLAGMLVFGAAITAAAPATQVLVLESRAPPPSGARSSPTSSPGMALGMAFGAFVAGPGRTSTPRAACGPLRRGAARLRRTAAFLAVPVQALRRRFGSARRDRTLDGVSRDGRRSRSPDATAGRPIGT